MKELLSLLSTSPSTLLIVAGILFLIISVVGDIDGKISPGKIGRIISGLIGSLLLVAGLIIYLKQPTFSEKNIAIDNSQTKIVSQQENNNPANEDINNLKERLAVTEEKAKALELKLNNEENKLKSDKQLTNNDRAAIEETIKSTKEEQVKVQNESSSIKEEEYATPINEASVLLDNLVSKAEQGDSDAQNTLGYKYFRGKDVQQNDEEAVRWYRMAAEQGHLKAQNNLGWMYETSRGVRGNTEQAIYWYHKAAEKGYIKAQLNLAKILKNTDQAESIKWYRKAAEQGNIEAQQILETLVNP